jgi:hypothetical protein
MNEKEQNVIFLQDPFICNAIKMAKIKNTERFPVASLVVNVLC